MSAPVVRGVVELDVSRHVDRAGCIYDDARVAVHRALVTIPAGVAVRVRLGHARWLADGVLNLLAEMVADAASVEVVGADDRGVDRLVSRLNERLAVLR